MTAPGRQFGRSQCDQMNAVLLLLGLLASVAEGVWPNEEMWMPVAMVIDEWVWQLGSAEGTRQLQWARLPERESC